MLDLIFGAFIISALAICFILISAVPIYVIFVIIKWAENASEPRKNTFPQSDEREIKYKKSREELRDYLIKQAKAETENLKLRGAIFEITEASQIPGFHAKELGWVDVETELRSEAEKLLSKKAAQQYESCNCLTKLSYSIRFEKRLTNNATLGERKLRNEKIFRWEAAACEAIFAEEVDQNIPPTNFDLAILDGSNIAYWGKGDNPTLEPVAAVFQLLEEEKCGQTIIFDASIGHKVFGRYLSANEIKYELALIISGSKNIDRVIDDLVVRVVASGINADIEIIHRARKVRGVIISNDFFRDSVASRAIFKRRGYYAAGSACLLSPRK